MNPICLSSVFTLPAAVSDNHLKLAKSEHIKVLIYIFRNLSEKIDIGKISLASGVSEYDVNEALLYWADAGLLLPDKTTECTNITETKKAVVKSEKPTRVDVARRGLEDERIRYLLQETQLKLGRNIKNNEASTLLWLYEDIGLDVSLILLIVQYAVTHNKANIRFIEQTAVDWVNKGIDNLTDAEEQLRLLSESEIAWNIVLSAFGIERRKPSKKEIELSLLWVNEWKISKELLIAAYDECINHKAKLSFPYIAKIIENWHNSGITSPEEIKNETNQDSDDSDFGAFDLDLYEKMINSKD